MVYGLGGVGFGDGLNRIVVNISCLTVIPPRGSWAALLTLGGMTAWLLAVAKQPQGPDTSSAFVVNEIDQPAVGTTYA